MCFCLIFLFDRCNISLIVFKYINYINFFLYPIENMESSDESKPNFFKHVFKFDDDGKSELLNIIQYALLAIIPIVILNKSMQKIVPEADEEKGNIEILAEIVIQVIFMFIGLLIVHRIITYVPTYSGVKYPDVSIIFIILAVLMITMSLQTKLGDKVSILVERLSDLWNGNSPKNSKNSKNSKKLKNKKKLIQNEIQKVKMY